MKQIMQRTLEVVAGMQPIKSWGFKEGLSGFKKREDKPYKANRLKGKMVRKRKPRVPPYCAKEIYLKALGFKMSKLKDSEKPVKSKQPQLKVILKRRSQTASNKSCPASKSDKNSKVNEQKAKEHVKVKSSGKKRGAVSVKRELEDSPEEKQQNVKKTRLDSSKQNLDDGSEKKGTFIGESKMELGDKFNDEKSIKEEEERRRQDRNEKSIFLKDVGRKMSASDLKALVAVRVVAKNAWLIFSSKSARAKAYGAISSKKVDGKPIVADLCGSAAKNAKPVQTCMADRPVDFLEIVVSGLPKKSTKESLQTIFPRAVAINVVTKFKALPLKAFIRFDEKQFAREAFASGSWFIIGGAPVDVFYSRKKTPVYKMLKPDMKESKNQSEEGSKKAARSQVKNEDNNSSGGGDGGEKNDDSSDGGSDEYVSDSCDEDQSEEGSFEDDSRAESSEEGIEETSH